MTRYGTEIGVIRSNKTLPSGLPPLREGLDHRIQQVDPSVRMVQSPIRYPAQYQVQMAFKSKNYLAGGRWFRSGKPDAIPTFVVQKKDPTVGRLTFDEEQRKRNTVTDKTPMPNTESILDAMLRMKHRSQFNL